MDIVKQNMLMTAELIKIMKLLEENGIEAISFKGPLLSQMAYGDITLRQYVDLDILIPEESLYHAAKLLSSNDYTSHSPISLLQNKRFRILDNDFSFFTPKNQVHIELHWRLFRKKIGKHKSFQEYYSNKLNIDINHNALPTLALETLLVYLCIHASKHAWERIEWINDVHLLVETQASKINWMNVLSIAKEMDSKIALFSGLNISKTFYKTTLPSSITELIYTDSLNQLTQDALYFIANPLSNQESYNHYRKIMLFQTKLLDSKWKQVKYIFNSYFSITRNDYLAFPLPAYLSVLYYFIKPFRVLYKVIIKGK